MKLRLKSHTVKFKITTEELEQLAVSGKISTRTVIPSCRGDTVKFHYEIVRRSDDGSSDLTVRPDGFSLLLSEPEWQQLADHTQKAVYIRREWRDEQDRMQRTVIYVEKDKAHKQKKEKEEAQPGKS